MILTAPHMDFVITLCDAPDGPRCADFSNVPVSVENVLTTANGCLAPKAVLRATFA